MMLDLLCGGEVRSLTQMNEILIVELWDVIECTLVCVHVVGVYVAQHGMYWLHLDMVKFKGHPINLVSRWHDMRQHWHNVDMIVAQITYDKVHNEVKQLNLLTLQIVSP